MDDPVARARSLVAIVGDDSIAWVDALIQEAPALLAELANEVERLRAIQDDIYEDERSRD